MTIADVKLEEGDIPLSNAEIKRDFEIVLQRVEAALALHQGEWTPDTTAGFPWSEFLQQRPPQVTEISGVVADEIESVEGVDEVRSFEASFDNDQAVIAFTGEIVGDVDSDAVAEFSIEYDVQEGNCSSLTIHQIEGTI